MDDEQMLAMNMAIDAVWHCLNVCGIAVPSTAIKSIPFHENWM
jgi:hypothetical protein